MSYSLPPQVFYVWGEVVETMQVYVMILEQVCSKSVW